jgi:hypothetical protein
MFKFFKIVKYIRKYRKLGYSRFKILTTSKYLIIKVVVYPEDKGFSDSLRIKY